MCDLLVIIVPTAPQNFNFINFTNSGATLSVTFKAAPIPILQVPSAAILNVFTSTSTDTDGVGAQHQNLEESFHLLPLFFMRISIVTQVQIPLLCLVKSCYYFI